MSTRDLTGHPTLTRDQVRFPGTRTGIPVPAESASTQREAFDLIGA